MPELDARDMHLIKKALAIAVMVIEANDTEFQSASDMNDMKALLDRLLPGDAMLAEYLRMARVQVTGKP